LAARTRTSRDIFGFGRSDPCGKENGNEARPRNSGASQVHLLGNTHIFGLDEKAQRFFAAFAADAAGFHADASARMSFRKEVFTFLEVGNTFATSGARTTTLVPSA
jgi:hypothetical protein